MLGTRSTVVAIITTNAQGSSKIENENEKKKNIMKHETLKRRYWVRIAMQPSERNAQRWDSERGNKCGKNMKTPIIYC